MEPREFVERELMIIGAMFNIQKELYPQVVLIKDDKRFPMPVNFPNSARKDIISQGIKDLVRTSEPDIVVFMAEAWMKIITTEVVRKQINFEATDPDKIEIIAVQIEFKTGEKFGCEARIIRDEYGTRLGEFKITNSDISMGRFIDFFPIGRLN